jgi:predicted DNA-binding transcriptional regulator AlpA
MTMLADPTPASSTTSAQLMTPGQLATFLQVSTERLYDWRSSGIGPRFVKLSGREVRYAWRDVREWLEANTLERTQGRTRA